MKEMGPQTQAWLRETVASPHFHYVLAAVKRAARYPAGLEEHPHQHIHVAGYNEGMDHFADLLVELADTDTTTKKPQQRIKYED